MKILFQSRTTLFSVPGGDTVQMLKTAEALREKGCHVDVTTDLEPDVSSYDVIHLFNLMRPQEVYLQARNAKRYAKKIALSTIYGRYTEYEKKARHGAAGLIAKMFSYNQIEYLKIAARACKNMEFNKGTILVLSRGYHTLKKRTNAMVDVFLPNSYSEMRRVIKDHGLNDPKFVVVPNAVDAEVFNYEKVTIAPDVEQYKDCVLCVARIEGRKSQLNLVRAFKGLPYKLVLIGKPAPNHMDYYEMVKRAAGDNVYFLGHIEHALLPQFYKAAKVHCLISWMETPGLSSLEAAAMGCNLVITDKGDTRDYFGDYAYYCDPASVDSIRNAVIEAYKTPVNPGLREHVLRNFTWEKAAEKTMEGYKKALQH
ncbi:MAG: glycosyltransferase family 4 protein [Thermodesulfobacteriota bacterium]